MAQKSIHSMVLDAAPILTNSPSISSLLAKSEQIFVTPSVISEIKDIDARSRLETTILPFITIRDPNIESVRIIEEFSRKAGELGVLSRTDIRVIALAYELEIERNCGPWRLRRTPGQRGINGPVPPKIGSHEPASEDGDKAAGLDTSAQNVEKPADIITEALSDVPATDSPVAILDHQVSDPRSTLHISHNILTQEDEARESGPTADTQDDPDDSDSASSGWITPSNLKRQVQNTDSSTTSASEKKIQVGVLTTDFAMQNVLLQMGLNLLSPSMQQIRHIRTYILRCHACFQKTKDMTKQFCPRCGKPTLTRVSCSTNAKGEFKIHLKKNMQWNHRGDRFSIPKPVSGAANGKVGQGRGGGKGGWGQELILAEDQKEYGRAMSGQNRKKEKNLMDEDYLPSILTGERGRAGGRPKIGAGRNVNSKKR